MFLRRFSAYFTMGCALCVALWRQDVRRFWCHAVQTELCGTGGVFSLPLVGTRGACSGPPKVAANSSFSVQEAAVTLRKTASHP